MAQSQTQQNLYKVLDAIARLSTSNASRYIEDKEIAQELSLDIQDIRDYLDILGDEGKVKTANTFDGHAALLSAKGRIALKDPEYRPTNIDSDKISAEIGELGSSVIVGKDITQHVNNYISSSALDREPLSDEEKELLIAASKNEGQIILFRTQQKDFVRVGGHNYMNEEIPVSATPYCEALEDLIERGYVRHEGGNLYKLTSPGRRQARNLNPE